MWNLIRIHRRFIRDTIDLNKFGNNPITVFPSVLFLGTTFFIVHSFCHRHTRYRFTSFKTWFLRELTFHWSYFYLCKLWFISLRVYKDSINYACKETNLKNTVDARYCHLIGLFILSLMSSLPFISYMIKSYSRNRIPNFLMWVGEDPWMRTEIGLAGHYLNRPPRFTIASRRKDCSYHTHRSSSHEQAVVTSSTMFLRGSRSTEPLKHPNCDA